MGSWSKRSISTMQNRQSSLLSTFRNQCPLPKHPALLLGIYQQALLSLALLPLQPPLLETSCPLLLLHQPISNQHPLPLLKAPCHRPLSRQPVRGQNQHLLPCDLPGLTQSQVTLTR